MAFTNPWDATFETLPADIEGAKDGASRIRVMKRDARERMTQILGGVAGTNTITATTVFASSAPALTAGVVSVFIPAATNSGAATLNVDGAGAKNIFNNGAALLGGELIVNIPTLVEYDGTQYNILGPANGCAGSFSSTCSGPFAAAASTVTYSKVGRLCSLIFTSVITTGNSTAAIITLNMDNMPAAIRPAVAHKYYGPAVNNAGGVVTAPGLLRLTTSGHFTMDLSNITTNFASTAGNVGFDAFSVSYPTA